MNDTSPEAQRRYDELLRRLTPAQRLETVMRLNRTVRELALAGIRAAHPRASAERQKALLAWRLYGEQVARRLYGSELGEEG